MQKGSQQVEFGGIENVGAVFIPKAFGMYRELLDSTNSTTLPDIPDNIGTRWTSGPSEVNNSFNHTVF
ncbi:MAG: hypothetical protein RI572_07900 [Salegentibacter sp.]|uniref:hypothetical protein n=1 Tax=Salegentibacter sp. TaxID=1903072 RepID=UPI00286FF892|nr:hypothetical protein [Salegentibacter sp.]MDR9457320.1 hypothetical protein [Salegentibacter sp.]